jgi:hypothetical protein
MEVVVLNYSRPFGVGTCKGIDGTIYSISKKQYKKPFAYLVVGERIKGVKKYNFYGRLTLIDIEPISDKYFYENNPEMNYVCV